MHTMVYGIDSETCEGIPISLQMYSEDGNGEEYILFCDEHSAMREFFAWCKTLPRHITHVIYGHNLKFDLISIFYEAHKQLDSEFSFSYGDWQVSGCYAATPPVFAKITHKDKDRRTIYILDSFLWYSGALAQAADLFCPGLPKLKRPKNLGSVWFTEKDEAFCEYAMRDSVIAYHIGKAIQAMHKQYDLPPSVSLASMAANIFRRHFLEYTIPQPKDSIQLAALLSYHGGKNNVIPGAAPAWHTNVTGLDISSAYPYAMSELPAFSDKRLYKSYRLHRGSVNQVPPFGVYQISGKVAPCKWPVLFDHSFNPIQGKAITRVWVQGIELNEALRSGELKLTSIRGYYYDAERDNTAPAFKGFVSEFYEKKQTQKDKAWRHMYKITLNACYGKFIQTRKKKQGYWIEINPETDAPEILDVKTEAQAGGMYHPFIASAITAHTRAYIHQLEHKFKAIHTATDGIYTTLKNPKPFMRGRPRKGLGSLEIEGFGTLLLIRNKCYILYSRKSEKTFPSKAFKGKHIAKYAKHGFMGSVYQLEQLIAKNRRKYSVTKPNTLKTALKRGLQPNRFEKQDKTLRIGPIKLAKVR